MSDQWFENPKTGFLVTMNSFSLLLMKGSTSIKNTTFIRKKLATICIAIMLTSPRNVDPLIPQFYHYVNVSVLIRFSEKTSVFTLISSPIYHGDILKFFIFYYFDSDPRFPPFLAHLSRRLIGELIVYPWSGVRRTSSVRPSSVVRRPQCSNIFF